MSIQRKARRLWRKLLRKHVKPGGVILIDVEHDQWCGIYSAERVCNCNPDRVLKDATGKTLVRVRNAGFFDPLENMEDVLTAPRARKKS